MRRRTLYVGAGVLWVGALTVLSFLPYREKHALHTKGRLHSPGHVAAFFLTAVVLLRIARTAAGRAGVLLGLALLGAGVEMLQSAFDGYPVEWHDVVLDVLGVTVGAIAFALLGGMRERAATPGAATSP